MMHLKYSSAVCETKMRGHFSIRNILVMHAREYAGMHTHVLPPLSNLPTRTQNINIYMQRPSCGDFLVILYTTIQ